ncbi:MAG: acylphosphatase [Alphaproteobacteria bacterium]|nr:acylphosphatase [Alphaproteobacteria bacterium]
MATWTRITSPAELEAASLSLDSPLHFRVIGRVQGVGFRQWTVKTAQALALGGWVRNCGDGSVEILAIGTEANCRKLLSQSLTGPRLARVTAIELLDADLDGLPPASRNLLLQIDSV